MPRMLLYERDEFRRIHRVLGNYLALCCWVAGVDAVVLNRDEIERIFGTAFLNEPRRLDWLTEDVGAWFPHIKKLIYRAEAPASLYLSRVSMNDAIFEEQMLDSQRVGKASEGGLKASLYQDIHLCRREGFSFPTAQEITRNMLAIATGDIGIHEQLVLQGKQ
jgi:hypothetical protein